MDCFICSGNIAMCVIDEDGTEFIFTCGKCGLSIHANNRELMHKTVEFLQGAKTTEQQDTGKE